MHKPWGRRLLKLLAVYVIACTPDMWKLASIGPPVSGSSLALILATSLAAPPVYLYRLLAGEPAYLAAVAPFAAILAIGAVAVWLTERRRRSIAPPTSGPRDA